MHPVLCLPGVWEPLNWLLDLSQRELVPVLLLNLCLHGRKEEIGLPTVTETDHMRPSKIDPHVLHLPFVCRKTLVKE